MLYDTSNSFSDEIHEFHNSTLYPALDRCASNPASIAQVFTNNCQTMKSLYSAYCQNMSASRQAVANLGGEATPTSILLHCQQEVSILLQLHCSHAVHQLSFSFYLNLIFTNPNFNRIHYRLDISYRSPRTFSSQCNA